MSETQAPPDAMDPGNEAEIAACLDQLRHVGVERVGSAGERFDPSVHEAVMYQEQPGATDQHVNSVLRPGYRLGQQLLRPAQVVVAGPIRRHADDGQGTGY